MKCSRYRMSPAYLSAALINCMNSAAGTGTLGETVLRSIAHILGCVTAQDRSNNNESAGTLGLGHHESRVRR
jgi:hypothetical protein